MISTTPQSHFGMSGGMDYTTPPHLLAPNVWRTLFNLRENAGLKQVPRKVVWQSLGGTEDITALASAPTGFAEYSHWLAWTPTKLLQLLGSGGSQQLNSTLFNAGGTRWSVCEYNGSVIFVNSRNQVRVFRDGRLLEIYDHCKCYSLSHVPFTGDEGPPLGTGAFTGDPLVAGDGTLIGELGPTFTWTTGLYYRVYCEKPKYFERDAVVSVVSTYSLDGVHSITTTLTGQVTEQQPRYIVVKATNTVAAVPNTTNASPWIVQVTSQIVPSAKYCGVFFDHLVLGAPNINGVSLPDAVAWSHVADWANWTPNTDSEADSYTCTDYQRPDDIITGVTGMHIFHDLMLVFTPSCIYTLEYVGLPKVVRCRPLIQDYGNSLQYSSVSLDNAVAWLDAHHENFFIWRGQGPEAIGGPILNYFFNDISLASATIHDTFAYVDRRNNEVVWVYKSIASTGTYDKAVAFNYNNKTWSVRSVEGTTSFARFHRRAKTVSQLVGRCDAQTGTCAALEQSADYATLVWGTANGVILREAVSTDLDASLLAQAAPYAETGDYVYGSVQKVKEVSAMTINAAGTFSGISLGVAERRSLGTAVTYTTVGTWTPTTTEYMLTFTPRYGQVLRYKFTFTGTIRDAVFHGFEDNVLTANADR